MSESARISSARVKAIAAEIHRKAPQSQSSRKAEITMSETATGKGLIRFRASRILSSYRLKPAARRVRPKTAR